MKTHFFIIALAIFGIALLTNCEKETNTIEPATDESPAFTLKKKGSNKDSNKRGGQGNATFDVNFDGHWTPEVDGDGNDITDPTFKSGEGAPDRKAIGVRGEVIELKLKDVINIDSASNCLHTIKLLNYWEGEEPQTPMIIDKERKTRRARVGLWFVGKDIYNDSDVSYVLYALGDFIGDWPPSGTDTTTLEFTHYKLSTGSGSYDNPCDSGGEKELNGQNSINVTLTPQ